MYPIAEDELIPVKCGECEYIDVIWKKDLKLWQCPGGCKGAIDMKAEEYKPRITNDEAIRGLLNGQTQEN